MHLYSKVEINSAEILQPISGRSSNTQVWGMPCFFTIAPYIQIFIPMTFLNKKTNLACFFGKKIIKINPLFLERSAAYFFGSVHSFGFLNLTIIHFKYLYVKPLFHNPSKTVRYNFLTKPTD